MPSFPHLFYVQDEKQLQEALLFANACGAVTVTERGAIPALPTKEAVLKLLGQSLKDESWARSLSSSTFLS